VFHHQDNGKNRMTRIACIILQALIVALVIKIEIYTAAEAKEQPDLVGPAILGLALAAIAPAIAAGLDEWLRNRR
jgi:hypothetical protein